MKVRNPLNGTTVTSSNSLVLVMPDIASLMETTSSDIDEAIASQQTTEALLHMVHSDVMYCKGILGTYVIGKAMIVKRSKNEFRFKETPVGPHMVGQSHEDHVIQTLQGLAAKTANAYLDHEVEMDDYSVELENWISALAQALLMMAESRVALEEKVKNVFQPCDL
jgi:hypothetical protein